MDRKNLLEMRLKRFAYWFVGISLALIIWKLCKIETNVNEIDTIKAILEFQNGQLELTQQQIVLLEQFARNKLPSDLPIIYAITPTYWRYVQKAELTRISQTLQLVPNVHWIVVEDSDAKTNLVRNLIAESNLVATHLTAKTPPFEKLKDKDPRWKHHRGVEQRNIALKWLRDNLMGEKKRGIVYFMDDDNTYNVKVFKEMNKIKKVGVWPVGLVGGFNAETPVLDNVTGKVKGYTSGWKPTRPFAIDMAGFAINLNLILNQKNATFAYTMEKGLQESEFLSYFVKKEELEPLADNCTKIYVWHTRSEKPVVRGIVPGLEV